MLTFDHPLRAVFCSGLLTFPTCVYISIFTRGKDVADGIKGLSEGMNLEAEAE